MLRFRLFTTEVMRFEGGNADITGKLRMPGSSSAIAIGSTPPTTSNAGTGFWIDRTGLYTLLSNNRKVFIDATTGILYSGSHFVGGGEISLDADKLNVKGDTVSPTTVGVLNFICPIDTSVLNTIRAGDSTLLAIQTTVNQGRAARDSFHQIEVRRSGRTTARQSTQVRSTYSHHSFQGAGVHIGAAVTTDMAEGDLTATGNIRADTRFKRGGLDVYPFIQLTHTYVEVFNQACTNNTDYAIDFSTWVPDGAPLIVVRFLLSSATANVSGNMREYGQTGFSSEQLVVRGQVANQYNEVQGICSKDASGRVQVRCSGADATMIVRLIGYFT